MAISKWTKSPLKLLCSRIGDGLHGTPTYDDNSDIYFINGNNLKNGEIVTTSATKKVTSSDYEINYIELNDNSLLLSINGTIGEMAFYDNEKVMLGKSAAYLNFKTEINRFYYYYFQLKDVQNFFHNVATGSTIKNLGLKSIQDFEVPTPDQREWKPIANMLSILDKKIEINHKINADLEAMAKLIYDDWFVQFDFPDANGKPYKSSGGKMVYNEVLKREIPDNWQVKALGDLIIFERGISYKSKEISEQGTPMINLNSFHLTGQYKNKGLKYFSGSYENNKSVNVGDLVIAITDVTRNTDIIGKAFTIPNLFDGDILISCDVAKVIPLPLVNVEFLLQLFNSEHYHRYIKHFASGTLVLHLNLDGVNWCKISLPPIKLIKKYSDIRKQVDEKSSLITKENEKLIQLRDWRLPMLMNGQVTVNEV